MAKFIAVLAVMGTVLLSNTTLAQARQKDDAANHSNNRLLNRIGARDMVKAAADLRKAAEAFERCGGTLQAITSKIAEATVKSSRNLATMSRTFDPFGYKAAFMTIREQGQTIQALQQKIQDLQEAEIKRLKKERRKLKKKLSRRSRGKPRRRR